MIESNTNTKSKIFSIERAPPLPIGDVAHLGGGQIRHIFWDRRTRSTGSSEQTSAIHARTQKEAAQAVREKLTTISTGGLAMSRDLCRSVEAEMRRNKREPGTC